MYDHLVLQTAAGDDVPFTSLWGRPLLCIFLRHLA